MRILVFSQHFWPESFRINDVAQSLQQAGHDVTALTGQPNYPSGRIFDGYRAAATGTERWGAIKVQRVPLVPRGRGSAPRLVANYLSFIISSILLGAWRLRGQPFDVVFVYATSPLLQALGAIALARLKGAAVVTWVQDLWPQSLAATGYVKSPRALSAVTAVVRWIYAQQHLVLVQSPGFVPPVRALAPSTVPVRVHPNPSEAQDTRAAASALNLPIGFNVVFAGNMGTAQALDSVLDAAELLRDLPDLHFVLIGSGQRSAWLAEQVRTRGLQKVLLPGRYAARQMPAILAQAQALLVTLVDDPAMALTVPSKVQSYLAAGKPIIAALRGEVARVVLEASAGLVCAPANAQALALAVRSLYQLPGAERLRMGEAGRHFHDTHYAPEVLTPRLVAHLEAAVQLARQAQASATKK